MSEDWDPETLALRDRIDRVSAKNRDLLSRVQAREYKPSSIGLILVALVLFVFAGGMGWLAGTRARIHHLAALCQQL